MSVLNNNDIVCFDGGNRVTDKALLLGYERFNKLSGTESKRLKTVFFTVLLHGWVNSVTGEGNWDSKELVAQISQYYWNLGKNRSILMLSCFTGYGVAKQVALAFHKPVVAPQGAASISDHGQIMVVPYEDEKRNPSDQGYNIPDNERWMFFSPVGASEAISPFPVLHIPRACELASKYMFIQR